MTEEYRNEELERIVKETNKNLNKPWIQKGVDIINSGGGTKVKVGELKDLLEINETEKKVIFYGTYEEAHSKEEVKPFLENYRKGYEWIYTKPKF